MADFKRTDAECAYLEKEETNVESENKVHEEKTRDDLACQVSETCPPSVKRRIKALKRLQLESAHVEYIFAKEIHVLQCTYYQKKHQPVYDQRTKITSGAREPKDEEIDWTLDGDEKYEEKVSSAMQNLTTREGTKEKEPQKIDNVKGIPDFWLTIFQNVRMLSEIVHKCDETVLKDLVDVKVRFQGKESMEFALEFHFNQNKYFKNHVLTKEYAMSFIGHASNPFHFEGPEIIKCRGCIINWHEGKNLTLRKVEKSQLHESHKTITNVEPAESFFTFFDPPQFPDDANSDLYRKYQELYQKDFKIGHYLRERVIPHAVLYFTGEAPDEDDEVEQFDPGHSLSGVRCQEASNENPGDLKK